MVQRQASLTKIIYAVDLNSPMNNFNWAAQCKQISTIIFETCIEPANVTYHFRIFASVLIQVIYLHFSKSLANLPSYSFILA